MRILSEAMSDLLADSSNAVEPIIIIGIEWHGTNETLYADRDILEDDKIAVKGLIKSVDSMDAVTQLDGSGQNSNISFTLHDPSGEIKEIIDTVDIHSKRAVIYQWFEGLGINDKIILFEGLISSPIVWDESSRTVQLSAQTGIKSQLVGFSVDELSSNGAYHNSLLGKAWPMCFGTTAHVQALRLNEKIVGTLTEKLLVPDPSIDIRITELLEKQAIAMQQLVNFTDNDTEAALQSAQEELRSAAQQMSQQLEDIKEEYDELVRIRKEQKDFWSKGFVDIAVVGGLKFPAGVTFFVKINENIFQAQARGFTAGPFAPSFEEQAGLLRIFEPRMGEPERIIGVPVQKTGYKYIQGGSRVELIYSKINPEVTEAHYVASITPGSVLAVYAYRTFNGVRNLMQVPPSLYRIESKPLGALTITSVILKRPLSTMSFFFNWRTTLLEQFVQETYEKEKDVNKNPHLIQNGDWEDDLYISFDSSIGPNTARIIIYLINTYTDYEYDLESFTEVINLVEAFPANFALTERPSVNDLINDIAFQSRCAVWIKNGVYYIKYLPKQTTYTDTVEHDDMEVNSLRISATSTESLVTKMTATWRLNYAREQTKIIVMNNVEKYGIHEEDYDFYIYNDYNIVLKAVTFWLIRKSNVWKQVECDVFPNKLSIETLDTIRLESPHVTTDDHVDCEVLSSTYDSDRNVLSLSLWTPIRFGEMTPYEFAYPSLVTTVYPPPYDTKAGGGAGRNKGYVPTDPIQTDSSFTRFKLPEFNGLQKNRLGLLTGDGIPDGTTDVKGHADSYITATKNRRLIDGDPRPGDFSITTGSPVYSAVPIDIGPITQDDYQYKEYPPINASKAVGQGPYPAQIISKDEDTGEWNVNIYKQGLGGDSVSGKATEVHQDGDLIGIEGEWTHVFINKNEDGDEEYTFDWTMNAAFPVEMSSKEVGTVYHKGYTGDGEAQSVHQLYSADDAPMPAGSKGICCRTWSSTAGTIYQVQIPVYVPGED
jgi:hypothetical protein